MNSISNNTGLPYHIIAIDGKTSERRLYDEALPSPKYSLTHFRSSIEALSCITGRHKDIDLIMLDLSIDKDTGIGTLSHIKKELKLTTLPVFIVSSDHTPSDIISAIDAGANEFIIKPFNNNELSMRVDAAVERKRSLEEIPDSGAVLFSLARLAECNDNYMGRHIDRLVHMCAVFGKELNLKDEDIETLKKAAVLHDIGKLVVPDSILSSAEPLTPAQWQVVKEHPTYGAMLCKNLNAPEAVVEIVRHHHERLNGMGYPARLKGKSIPYLARVFQIVDVFDAITTDRAYKSAYPLKTAIFILKEGIDDGSWDKELMGVFMGILTKRPEELKLKISPNAWDRGFKMR